MGKKFTTFISTLTLAAGSLAVTISPPALATGEAEISLDDYWSFSEILELKTELDTAAKEHCGENYECKVEYRRQEIRNRYQEDPRYNFVGQIIDTNFIVTGINPTKETVSIYYNDENMMDWEFMREESHSHLKDIYLAWAEEGYPDMRNSRVSFNDGTRDRSGPVYVADANNGTTTEKVHLVFAHKPSDGDPVDSWLEYNKENVLDATGSGLINDTRHMLHFSVYAYEGFSAVGAVEYKKFAENYQPGMEYRLMYDKNTYHEYWIPQYVDGEGPTEEPTDEPVEEPTEDPAEEPTENPAEEPTENPAEEPLEGSTEQPIEEPADNPTEGQAESNNRESNNAVETSESDNVFTTSIKGGISTSDSGVPAESKDDTVELPLSGNIITQKSTAEEHVFPWWIIVFVFSGVILTLWWFIPIKKYEKSEKSVDKK